MTEFHFEITLLACVVKITNCPLVILLRVGLLLVFTVELDLTVDLIPSFLLTQGVTEDADPFITYSNG